MAFQPGQSGNPGGRPKERAWRESLRRAVNDITKDEDGTEVKKLDAVARRVVKAAMDGDIMAAREIGDRLDGKVPQALIGSDDPDDAPLTVALVELQAVKPTPE